MTTELETNYRSELDKVFRLYNHAGFEVAGIHADPEFKPLMDPAKGELGVDMNYYSAQEHVPQITAFKTGVGLNHEDADLVGLLDDPLKGLGVEAEEHGRAEDEEELHPSSPHHPPMQSNPSTIQSVKLDTLN